MFAFRKKNTQIQSPFASEYDMFIGWNSHKEFQSVKEGNSRDADEEHRYLHLQSLVEQGFAKWEPEEAPRGCLIDADDGSRLSESLHKLFKFPAIWDGGMELDAPYPTHSPKFTAKIALVLNNGKTTKMWQRKSCLLIHDGLEFTLSPQQLNAFKAYDQWNSIAAEERVEADHQHLIANLQKATQDIVPQIAEASDSEESDDVLKGAKIKIGFGDLTFEEAEWGISIKETDDGGFQLIPSPELEDPNLTKEVIDRIGQLKGSCERATFRLHNRIITLTADQTRRSRDIIKNGKLNRHQKEKFLEDPTRYLIDHVFTPESIDWSPRVQGIEKWTGSAGPSDSEGGMSQDVLGVPTKEKAQTAKSNDSKNFNGAPSSPQTKEDEGQYLPYPYLNELDTDFSESLAAERTLWTIDHDSVKNEEIDPTILKKGIALKPHQDQGLKWMLAHSRAIQNTADSGKEDSHIALNRGGVLLADDMGLGKTISVLSFIANHQIKLKKQGSSAAYLIIAPVSLLLNWKDELEKFIEYRPLLKRVIILHPDHDLDAYRVSPKSKDIFSAQNSEVKQLGIRTISQKEFIDDAIDTPGTLVITNYDTIRTFRFSLCAAHWEIVALDEAQYTKNPSTITTACVKALNAKFRVLMSGTPVENSLKDFWCLCDTHSPGLVGSLKEFTDNFIAKIRSSDPNDHEIRSEVADAIKSQVGATMLRRLKSEVLEADFPDKHEHHPDNSSKMQLTMSGEQLSLYNQVRSNSPADNETQDHHLAKLHEFRAVSLHPRLSDKGEIPIGETPAEAKSILRQSIKGVALVDTILPDIEAKNEKVLIFAISKKLQWGLARNLEIIYRDKYKKNLKSIAIINGDTKTTSTRANPSRQELIKSFEESKGFNICILSPVAAGVGLTITAANHVVHYERHWNPAKENQATDRAYRIGQTKDVHVWYPISQHPDPQIMSFDSALDALMRKKMSIQDSILNVEDMSVGSGEMKDMLEGKKLLRAWSEQRLASLNPDEFEALVACLYEKMGASEAKLTKKTGDKGADIVAYDYPSKFENTLIDAKHTTTDRPLNSTEGIKQVLAAKNFYEDALNKTFAHLEVVCNRKSASDRVKRAAEIQGVNIVNSTFLLDNLANIYLTLEEIHKKLVDDRVSI